MRKLTLLLVVGSLAAAGVLRAQDKTEDRYGIDPRQQRAGQQFDLAKVHGLAAWYRGSEGLRVEGQQVVGWADASGHGNDAVAEREENRPTLLRGALNGLPAVRFGVGPSQGRSLAMLVKRDMALGENPAGMTIIAVARLHGTTFFGPCVSYGDAFVLGQDGNTGRLLGANGDPLVGRGFHVLAATLSAADAAYAGYVDGQRVANRCPQFKTLPGKSYLMLGSNAQGENRGLLGDLAEVVVFHRVLTADELDRITRHLENRYGLSGDRYVTPLAAQLPYAYYPSSSEIEVAFDAGSPILMEYLAGRFRPGTQPGPTKPGLAMALFLTDEKKQHVDLAKDLPSRTGVLPRLAFEFEGKVIEGNGRRPHVLALRGFIDVPGDDVYRFCLRPWAFSRLQIAGQTVIDTYQQQTFNEHAGVIALAKGRHPIALTSRVHNQPTELPREFLWWSRAGGPEASIPAEAFSHSEVSTWKMPTDAVEPPPALPEPLRGLKQAEFRVASLVDGKELVRCVLPLDAQGRGQQRFPLPNLPDGGYAVDWLVAGKTIRATVPLRRIHFPWEGNRLGQEHKVYAPFEPVKVDGAKVSIVGRTYTLNAAGLLDSVISKGRELLAGPMTLHVQTEAGEVPWRDGRLAGRQVHEDLAVFEGGAASDVLRLASRVEIEEDGAARVTWDFKPADTPATIQRMWLEIPLKDAEVPLFHYTGNDSMRHNYAGRMPRGGHIVWEVDKEFGQPVQGWVPTTYRVEAGPADGVIWDSTKIHHWTAGNRDNFCPYVWLGAEERGLAWFGGTDRGYLSDGREPVQEVVRDGQRVLLRVWIVRQPVSSTQPRQIVFGLQASPTKPMPANWQKKTVPGGGGLAVHPWGGYQCSDKVPDGNNFEVVDYIQGVRATGKRIEGKLRELDGRRIWKDAKVHDDGDWIADLGHFEGAAKSDFDWKTFGGSGVYTEEHAQDIRAPDWQVFQDEWSIFEFNRFALQEGNWSQAAKSYRDYCLYYNREWLRRGVSVYFDNCMHRIAYNPYNQGFVGRTITIWEMRDYYKRIWKMLTRINLEGKAPYEVHFTGHVTNTQTIPQNSWMTATLDLEQPYRSDPARPRQYPAPEGTGGETRFFRPPFPADYTRTMTMGRLVGVIPHGMYPLVNWGDYREKLREQLDDRIHLADWGMYRVHEVRWGGSISKTAERLMENLWDFGYGQPGTRVINYWDEGSPVKIEGGDVKYIAILRQKQPFAFLVLQSYQEQPAKINVRLPGAAAAMDLITRRAETMDNGELSVAMGGPYGTRVFLLADRVQSLRPAVGGDDVLFADNFEYGIRLPAVPGRVWGRQPHEQPLRLAPDARDPANTVLRFHATSAGQVSLGVPPDTDLGDHEFSFRFRLPQIAGQPVDQGVIGLGYQTPRSSIDARVAILGGTAPAMTAMLSGSLDGRPVAFAGADVAVDLRGKPAPNVKVDAQWHTFRLRFEGNRQLLRIDDAVVFDGRSRLSAKGAWRIFGTVDPSHIGAIQVTEIDDVVVRRVVKCGPN